MRDNHIPHSKSKIQNPKFLLSGTAVILHVTREVERSEDSDAFMAHVRIFVRALLFRYPFNYHETSSTDPLSTLGPTDSDRPARCLGSTELYVAGQ